MAPNCGACNLRVVQTRVEARPDPAHPGKDAAPAGIEVLIVDTETRRVPFRYLVPDSTGPHDRRQDDSMLRFQPCGHRGGGEAGKEAFACPMAVFMDHGEATFRKANSQELYEGPL